MLSHSSLRPLAIFCFANGMTILLRNFAPNGWRYVSMLLNPLGLIILLLILLTSDKFSFVMALGIVGLGCNLAVIAVNRWHMPVVGFAALPVMPGFYALADTSTRWRWLADQKMFGGFSIGDFLLILAVVIRVLKGGW